MQLLDTLISELEGHIDAEGNSDFIIDKDLNQLRGELLQVQQKIVELNTTQAALGEDVNRARGLVKEKEAKIAEQETSLAEQLKTIQQQSETLNKREEIVNDLTAQLAVLRDDPEGGTEGALIDEVDANIYSFTGALERYAVRLARTAPNENTALTAVHLLQLSGQLEGFEDWDRAHTWLITGQ